LLDRMKEVFLYWALSTRLSFDGRIKRPQKTAKFRGFLGLDIFALLGGSYSIGMKRGDGPVFFPGRVDSIGILWATQAAVVAA